MKKFFQKHALTIWIIASIVAIIVVHFLFYYPAPYKWMIANWSSGEILTYISTVALSLLAVWQNKRFKEENDASQARLAKLVSNSNELSLINKIVEIENERLNQLKEAIEDFTSECDPRLILNEYIKKGPNRILIITVRGEIENNINQSYFKIKRLLRKDYTLKEDAAVIDKAIGDYYDSVMKLIRELDINGINHIDKISEDTFDSINNTRKEYLKQREQYIKCLESKLNQVIYGDIGLEEIKRLYHME